MTISEAGASIYIKGPAVSVSMRQPLSQLITMVLGCRCTFGIVWSHCEPMFGPVVMLRCGSLERQHINSGRDASRAGQHV